jgi:Protein of unknown function (DUF1592)/Protein of unknown function (DUF1588)/Protein of unknown function (DUF1585)/Protein of unknown function (DUF1587)/Protein of unknown function (DUF1595)
VSKFIPAILTALLIPSASMASEESAADAPNDLLEQYCVTCHNDATRLGGMSLEAFDAEHPEKVAELAEKMIRKLRAGMMPPAGMPRPEDADALVFVASLERAIDAYAEGARDPGSRPSQRLNRAEYARLVKDLVGLTVDPGEWLPEDPLSGSFDNIADVQTMSPTLMTAYLTAASEVAREALGQGDAPVLATTYTNPPSVSQHEWERIEGAPFGTRGGISVIHHFPADGKYTFSMGFISGWGERFHDIDLSIDGEQVALLRYGGDIDFQGRKDFPIATDPIFIRAGEHRVTAAFIRQMDGPYEDLIRPNDWSLTGTETSYGTTAPPHLTSLTLEGPYEAVGVSESPSRMLVFSCRPTSPAEEKPCAESIVTRLAAKAYGRDVEEDDVSDLMGFYTLGAQEGGFEVGVRTALEAILVSPHFLYRMEREPAEIAPGEVYRIADIDLASRLSFFLWGTNPDEELLRLARSGELSQDPVLRGQTARMLEDPRSEALATRFAAQWLRLQDLEKVSPDAFWFPNYNRQLMEAMRRETEVFFDQLVRQDRSFLELYSADYSYMNERLAQHYGISGVVGEAFRRVSYPANERKGILGHGSVLVQTSLGNRTSPVLRGKWVMEVLLGSPPPPPPPDVPDLEKTEGSKDGKPLTTRERLEKHREDPTCNSCHTFIDPIGLALDNFDVTGKWRIREFGVPLDTRSTFYDGTPIETPGDLVEVLLKRPDPLVRQFTENLMAYALGRTITYRDQPTIRAMVSNAEQNAYRMSSFIQGVVMSDEFRMKQKPIETDETDRSMSEQH